MRQHILNLALKLQGTPYVWGGSSPSEGLDCSGYVIWILQVFDVLTSVFDATAEGLRKTFPEVGLKDLKKGDLVFYGKDTATHVMIFAGWLDGNPMCVGESGGDSTTTTREIAKSKGAQVKIKHIDYRTDRLGFASIGAFD